MNPAIIRIILRYGAGALVAKGILDYDTAASLSTDQDLISLVQIGIATIVSIGTEVAYYLAHKFGWKK